MISGIFHEGSGLGNQLHRYVATRVLATDKGYEWGMENPQNFKGGSFMNLDMGKPVFKTHTLFQEKKIVENGIDIRGYDPEINFVHDSTCIDGEFQDYRYFGHKLDEVREWLKVESLDMPDDLCVIGFRGGEYALYHDLFLSKEYFVKAMDKIKEINPNVSFTVVTDDVGLARSFFYGIIPIDHIHHNIGQDWRFIRYAKYLIIANSSFYILPALLNQNVKKIIAPRYWARHNIGIWACMSNYYSQFTYI